MHVCKSVMFDEPVPALLSDVYCLLTKQCHSSFLWFCHQLVHRVTVLASFPGLLWLQFLITCSMQNEGRRPGESYHVICGTDVTCRHAYMYSHAREKTDLVF